MSDIKEIKKQIEKIKKAVNENKETDKQIIIKLNNQLQTINKSITSINSMAKKIKGGRYKRCKKGGGCKYHKKKKKN